MTILLSTHILTDMEELCDRVGFVDHGRLVEEGSLQELRAKYAHPLLRLGFADAAQAQQAQRALAPLLQLQPEQSKQAGGSLSPTHRQQARQHNMKSVSPTQDHTNKQRIWPCKPYSKLV